MKVIFLDIDGVLNTSGNYMDPMRGVDALDDDLVKRVRMLVKGAGAYWVLASSWRMAYGGLPTVAALQRHGWPEAKQTYLGYTPSLPDQPRGAEITAWLSRHPDVEQYVILDDRPDAGVGHDVDAHFTRTIGTMGLTMRNCLKAAAQLRSESVRT